MDRGGTFLGSLRTTGPKPVSLGMALLESGLAQLSDRFDPERTPGGREMVAAQERARAARLKARPPSSAPAPLASVWGGPAAASGQWCLRS